MMLEPEGMSAADSMSPGERSRPNLSALILMLSPGWLLGFTLTLFAPALPMIAQTLGPAGAFNAQMIVIMPSLGIIFGGILAGLALERLGPKALLIIGLSSYAALGVVPFLTMELPVILISRFLLGLAASGVVTAITDLIARFFDGDARNKMLGYQGALGSALGALSFLLSGAIASRWGWQAASLPYLVAAPLLMLAVFGIPRFPPAKALAKPAEAAKLPRRMTGGVAPYWFGITIAFATVQFMVNVQVPFAMHEDGISSPSSISYIIFSGAVATSLGAASFGLVAARLGRGGTLKLMLTIVAIGASVIGLSQDALTTTAGCVIAGYGGGLVGPYLYSIVLSEARPEGRGRAIGLSQAAFFLGDFVNPLVAAPLRPLVGTRGLFLVVACAIWLALVILALRPMWRRALAEPAASRV